MGASDRSIVAAGEELQLWLAWREHGDEAARTRLLDAHLPYARTVAATYYKRRTHDEIEFDEYLQLASLGLVEAVGRFDPGAGAQFRTFAAPRMHGAILDGLEKLTEKQQQISAWQRVRNERKEDLKAAATQRAKAKKVQSPNDRILEVVAEAGFAFAVAWILEGTGMVEEHESRAAAQHFYDAAEMRSMRARLLDAVNALVPQERTVIKRHYLDDIAFEQIAREMGVTRGRISQLHRAGITKLRDGLQHEKQTAAW